MFFNILFHPYRTWNEWKHYRIIDEVNPLRFELYKANFEYVLDVINPDLIHLHGAGLSPLYYAKKTLNKGAKILLTLHGVMYNVEDTSSWHFKKWYLSQMEMADYFTVLNKETERKALLLGLPRERCSIIPNGVDTERFYYAEDEREKLRKDYGALEKTIVFVTTGGVLGRKGQYDFLCILQSLGIEYQYWIIGEGEDVTKIRAYVEENQIFDRVKLFGYIDGRELYKYLSAADFYAHVSTTEGQALSEIEAYATGLRIVLRKEIEKTVIGDPKKEQDTYFVLDFSDVAQDALISWLSKTNCERISRDNYNWESIAQKYQQLYIDIISKDIK